ncbi:sigma-54 interaction domain-containing protein [Tissierella creatinophila]|uniref:HTH-type transcriptional regulatory protein TyrR n=1 Tax=Tissierella creatinophila DSM 6911 TaxID=1123403 RepID=A0A1U7M8P9_TISCR|nr:sigma 54-interacting transcriptional regulator [Tissierella creatinophila]OLS03589.1 Nif-specific regulatory protein [Tissierella creatinophila DSM 6911]
MYDFISLKEKLLKENPDYIFGALEFSSDGIFICDNEGKTIYVNPAYEMITGLKRSEVIGKELSKLLKENKFNISASLKVLETKEPVSLIHRYVSGRSALTTATPIYDDNEKNIIGVICNTRNIEELMNLRKELENVNLIKQRYSQELELLRKQHFSAKGLIYKSMAMKETLEIASTVAKFDSTILITGESGTGKEVLATFIYQNSNRKDKAFIKVNCAAIPKNLFESELFGYMPGSFTGASDKGKAGMFELANGGTILLDEIGELTMPIQSKLLRVIQEQEVYRVGGTEPIKLDVRIIASTNRDLLKEIKNDNFREDLYFRLNVVPLQIPPLRKRAEDISEMIKYFMTKLNSKYNKNIIMSQKAEEALVNYSWPGNVRELQNIIEYMFIMNDREEICFEQLPDKILNGHVLMNASIHTIENKGRLEYLMEVYEKTILKSALSNHSSIRKAAKTLGINASTLSRKIKKYEIEI